MSQYDRVFRILGPIIGFALLYYVLTSAAGYLQRGQLVLVDEATTAAAAPEAGAAITETMAATGTTTVTDTAASPVVTDTAAVTETVVVTETVAVTGTAAVSETAAVTGATALTDTAAVTDVVAVTTTAAVTDAAVTTTLPVTTTQVVTATAAPAVAPTAAPAAAAPAAAVDMAVDMAAVTAAVTKGGCGACHVMPGVPNAMGVVGPDMTNIGNEAGTRVPGQTAEEYIHESIVNPNAHTAPECPFGACVTGTMPANITQLLAEDEIATLVQYLLAQKGGS